MLAQQIYEKEKFSRTPLIVSRIIDHSKDANPHLDQSNPLTVRTCTGPGSTDIGSRVMVDSLRVIDPTTGKQLGIYMIYAYEPSSNASEDIKLKFGDSLATSISRRHFGDILIICADANASKSRAE